MNVWEFLKGQLQLCFYAMHNTYLPFGDKDFSVWDLAVTLSVIAVVAAYLGFHNEEEE